MIHAYLSLASGPKLALDIPVTSKKEPRRLKHQAYLETQQRLTQMEAYPELQEKIV